MDKLMSYKFWLAALALLLVPMFFTSCEDIVETDEELLPFFDMFAEEGAERAVSYTHLTLPTICSV